MVFGIVLDGWCQRCRLGLVALVSAHLDARFCSWLFVASSWHLASDSEEWSILAAYASDRGTEKGSSKTPVISQPVADVSSIYLTAVYLSVRTVRDVYCAAWFVTGVIHLRVTKGKY